MKKYLPILLLSLCFIISSCGDDGSPPVISITSPQDGQTFLKGDIVDLNATITDDEGLSNINLQGAGINESITMFDTPTSHSFSAGIEIPISFPSGVYELTLVATDNEGMTASETRSITVQ